MNHFDVIILGAGASGLMCASTAAARGRKTLVLDHARQAGNKVLIAGGGKCNFTNKNISHEQYVGANPQFARSALAQFTSEDAQELVKKHRVAIEEREEGQLFCKYSSKDFLRVLLTPCKEHEVIFRFNQSVQSVNVTAKCFTVTTNQGTYTAESVVIALGGTTWPQAGATDAGYRIAKSLGHKLLEMRPALVGLSMVRDWGLSGLEGISLRVSIDHVANSDLQVNEHDERLQGKRQTVAENLPMLFTHTGISGPAGLQASLYWKKGDVLLCNFLPEHDMQRLLALPENGKLLVKTLLKRLLPTRLSEVLVDKNLAERKVAELSRAQRFNVHQHVHESIIFPDKTDGLKKAEVTVGGVDTEYVSSRTMESKLVKNLFLCGEVLDITGRLGGYNIHWALASGLAAGKFA